MSADRLGLITEVLEKGARWRAEHSDLPATLLILSRVKRSLPELAEGSKAKEVWSALRKQGERFARRRALLTAAEAVGRLRREKKVAEWEKIRSELGVVINEGSSLHKVRALRAMSFIASDECIPYIKRGLRDESPWVQATTLHTLFRLDLRGKEPRKVVTEFLFETFRQSIALKWESLNPETISKNFQLNRGLFLALLKEKGGQGLALLALSLWFASLLLLVTVPLAGLLSALTVGLFVVLPCGLLMAPLLARNILNPPKQVSRAHIVGLALLDYALIPLMVFVGLPYGLRYLGIGLGAFYAFLLFSWPFNNESFPSAERFRRFNRSLFTGVTAWFAYHSGRPFELTAAISLLALAQFIWTFPRFFPGLVRAFIPPEGIFFRTAVALLRFFFISLPRALWRFSQWFFKKLVHGIPWAAKGLYDLRESPRVRALPGRLTAKLSDLERPAQAIKADVTEIIRKNVRPRPKHFVIAGCVVVAVAAAVYFVRKAVADVTPEEFQAWLIPLLRGPLAFTVKPYLYGIAGGLLLLICCGVVLICFYYLWDELWYVDRIRFYILSQRRAHPPDSPEQFLAYIFQTIRNRSLPNGIRVRAASNLAQVPELSRKESYLDQLMDLAEEDDLPLGVRDAVQKSVYAAQERMSRGPSRTTDGDREIDMESINQQVETLYQPGLILRPKIEKGLLLLIGCAILAGAAQLFFFSTGRAIDTAAAAELGVGCCLLIYYYMTEGSLWARKWSLITGVILLSVALTHPLQDYLMNATRPGFFFNFGMEFIDGATLLALFVPVALSCIVAQVGHTFYLLESDTKIGVEYKSKSNIFTRWSERMGRRHDMMSRALRIAIVAAALQSAPLQELIELRNEKMPSFASNGKDYEIELRGIPTDGRVIRVALVGVQKQPDLPFDGTLPTAFDAGVSKLVEDDQTYTPSIERTFAPVFKDKDNVRNDPEHIVGPIYGGEIWFAAQDGKIQVWQHLPARCIGSSEPNGDTITFDFHSLCPPYRVKVRVVAIVYNKRRSELVKRRASRENVLREFHSATSPNHRLLADTLSPFTRVLWSPIF